MSLLGPPRSRPRDHHPGPARDLGRWRARGPCRRLCCGCGMPPPGRSGRKHGVGAQGRCRGRYPSRLSQPSDPATSLRRRCSPQEARTSRRCRGGQRLSVSSSWGLRGPGVRWGFGPLDEPPYRPPAPRSALLPPRGPRRDQRALSDTSASSASSRATKSRSERIAPIRSVSASECSTNFWSSWFKCPR